MAERAGEALWWQKGVIYQIYPRSFQDSTGDGIGDLPGIIGRVPYLADTLGIDAVWLSPFYPSPMADFGYDVSNYTEVHPLFGTVADFDRLVAALHDQQMQLIIDFVPNHSSEQHPWFIESRSSKDNPKRDWYVWADAAADGGPPNNWLSVFGGSAWEWDEATRQYYLHVFLKEQPDLNWRNPEVKAAMFDAMRFWLDRGVDGFRLDAVLHIAKDPEMRDNPRDPHSAGQPSQLHVYDQADPSIHDLFREMRNVVDEYQPPRVLVGELYMVDWKVWASYYGRGDEIHLPFNFALLYPPFDAASYRNVVDSTDAAVPPEGWPNYVLGNHDNPRVATRLGVSQARLAGFMLLTLRGTPTMYYGDELGMQDVPIPPERQQDPARRQGPGAGRDPERTPMQWDHGPNAGFCPPDVQPWLPLTSDYQQVNVAAELDDKSSMLCMTRRLLELRRQTPALSIGSYRPIGGTDQNCFLFMREHEGHRQLVALNFSAEEQTVSLRGYRGSILVSTHLDREHEQSAGDLRLRPYEGVIVRVE